jgi:predicted site-specific integrase-resolvase
MENTEKTLVTRAEAADRFMITVRTIDRWATSGLINKYRNSLGYVRVSVEEISRVVNFGS